MPAAQQTLFKGQCLPVQPLCFLQLALTMLKSRQIAEIHGDFEVFSTVGTLENREGSPIERFGFVVPPLTFNKRRKSSYIGCDRRVIGT